jgi:protein-S-isoprenylcysteine O-methyltransferase Ste14
MEPRSPSTPTDRPDILKSLVLPGIRNFVIGAVVLGAVLCLLAGSLRYWQGWVFAVLFTGLTTAQGIYLGIKDPALLERRKNIATEGESKGQRIFIVVALLVELCLILFPAVDHRFGWSHVPALVSVVGDALMVLSFVVYYFVFEENSFAASSIQTFEGQQVIATGPYGMLRHPKYAGDLLLNVGIALALGSWWALFFVLLALPMLAWRILDEEKLLRKDLPGYDDYMHKVRYRLVPYLW